MKLQAANLLSWLDTDGFEDYSVDDNIPAMATQRNLPVSSNETEQYFICSICAEHISKLPASAISLTHESTNDVNETPAVQDLLDKQSKDGIFKWLPPPRPFEALNNASTNLVFSFAKSLSVKHFRRIAKVASIENSTTFSLCWFFQSSRTRKVVRHAKSKLLLAQNCQGRTLTIQKMCKMPQSTRTQSTLATPQAIPCQRHPLHFFAM